MPQHPLSGPFQNSDRPTRKYFFKRFLLGILNGFEIASENYLEALFDDAEDILATEEAGLVTIEEPGLVVLCPVIFEQGADAPGNILLRKTFRHSQTLSTVCCVKI